MFGNFFGNFFGKWFGFQLGPSLEAEYPTDLSFISNVPPSNRTSLVPNLVRISVVSSISRNSDVPVGANRG